MSQPTTAHASSQWSINYEVHGMNVRELHALDEKIVSPIFLAHEPLHPLARQEHTQPFVVFWPACEEANVDITAFATSHDAAEPQYYVFTSGGKRVAFLTDTGYVSEEVEGTIEDADAYMMEFNYDNMMLRDGPYSWALKQRILSDVGHLSNDEAAQALVDVVTPKTKHIFLAHRSQHNNTEYLAHETAKEMLLEGDANLDDDVKIIDTEPNQPTKLVEI